MLPGLEDSAVRAGYVDAVVPPGLSPEDDIRARRRAGSFVDAVIRLAGGDETVLTHLAAEVRAAAVEVIALGLEPGVILDRLDAGRRVLLRALDSRDPPAGTLSELDDRLAAIQQAARIGIDEAIAADAAWIDGVAARVLGQTTGTSDPEAVLQAATAAFADLVGADTVRLWADVGGGSLELVASAGDEGDALAGRTFFVSSERGRLAETLRARRPQRRAPLGDSEMLRAWQAMVPGLRRRPVAGLFLPLCLAERSFALLYGVRYEDRPFSSSDERLGDRLARRIEPTLAWSLQARTARRVSAATQDFLRITTHELRRPLTVLRGYIEMLRTADDQEAPVFQERIERASDRMATLLSEITEMVMLEDPQRPLDIAAHRLGDLAARIEWPARDEAEQRGCELVAQVGDPDAIVNCDRHHIEHAVANLLSNAFRHTGGHRRVWLSIGTSGARTWRIAVRDEGDGVNPGEVERIFDKYYRSEQTRQSGWEGSGLGLHYVRLVAERHGGRVSADNLETGGAEFTLVLPVAAGVAPWSI